MMRIAPSTLNSGRIRAIGVAEVAMAVALEMEVALAEVTGISVLVELA